jgi:hypothetical protein
VVIRSTEQVATEVGVPGQAVALLLVAPQAQVWAALTTGVYERERQDGRKMLRPEKGQMHIKLLLSGTGFMFSWSDGIVPKVQTQTFESRPIAF